jgi:hypothetical protein
MYKWETGPNMQGGRSQSAIPRQPLPFDYENAQGLLLRGVVVATYEVDDENNPEKELSGDTTPSAIYCDVLTYSSLQRQQVLYLRGCLVSQDRGGIHRGRIFKPRAARLDKTGNPIDLNNNTNVANLDGDHVLVGFVDGRFNTPIILRGIPHPSADAGNEGDTQRRRMRLVQTDGDPDFFKHHGTIHGVDDDGNWGVDTRFANDGTLKEDAGEQPPPTDGKGSQHHQLPLDGVFTVDLSDMSDPNSPQAKVRLTLSRNSMQVTYPDSSISFTIDADNQIIEMGATGNNDRVVIATKADDEHQDIRDQVSDLADEIRQHAHALSMYFVPLIPNPGKPIAEVTKPPIIVATGAGGDPNVINAITQGEAGAGAAPTKITSSIPEYDPFLFTDGGNAGDVASERVTIDK